MYSNNIDTKYSRSQIANLNKVFFASNVNAKFVLGDAASNERRGRKITTSSPMLFFPGTFIDHGNLQRWYCPVLFSKIGNPRNYTAATDSGVDNYFNSYTVQTSNGKNCYLLIMNSGSYNSGIFFFYGADGLVYRQLPTNQNPCIDIENIIYGTTNQNDTALFDLLYSYVPD